MLPHQAVAEHPVGEVLVVAPEVVDGVDHAGELALPGQLLVQPIAGQPVGHMVILKWFKQRMSILNVVILKSIQLALESSSLQTSIMFLISFVTNFSILRASRKASSASPHVYLSMMGSRSPLGVER